MADNPYSSQGGQQGAWPYGSSAYPGSPKGGQQNPVSGAQSGPAPTPYVPQGYQGGKQQMQQMPQGFQMQMYPGQGAQGAGVPGVPSSGYQFPANQTSYIENILRLNLEKEVTVYATFENNTEWNAKKFHGELEAAGKDHVIINDNTTGTRYLILMVYIDYVTFHGPVNYAYPYQ